MKTINVVLLSIIISIGILLAGYAGLMYLGAKMWESGWVRGDSIEGPDGYTYCLMLETGLMQDPHTKLIRTKDIKNEDTYEVLGSTNDESSWLPVIRPLNSPKVEGDMRYLPTNNVVYGVSHYNKVYFIYDIDNDQYYEGYESGEMSPFILIEHEDTKLYKPDIFPVLMRVVKEYDFYIDTKKYLEPDIKDSEIEEQLGKQYLADWPSPEALKGGMSHPNEEVRKLSKWIMAIQENGLSHDSEAIDELITFLIENINIKDDYAQDCLISTLGYFRNSYITKAIPCMEEIILRKDEKIASDVAESLGRMGSPAYPFLVECLKSEDESIRHLGLVGFSNADADARIYVEEIKLLLNDSSINVRQQASEALDRIKWSCEMVQLIQLHRQPNE